MGHSVAWQIRNIKDIMLTVKIEIKVSQVENGGTYFVAWQIINIKDIMLTVKNIDKSESSRKWGHMGHSVAWQIRNIKDIMLTVKI